MSSASQVTRRISWLTVVLLTVGFVSVSGGQLPSANATGSNSLGVYIDSPFVQGSYVAAAGGAGVASMSFNGTTGANQCGAGAPSGVSITGTCTIYSVQGHGGASVLATNATPTTSTPTTTIPGSNFPSTTHDTNPVIINLTQESRYLGLWWSAGSTGNEMRFYKDNTLLLTVNTDTITTLLGTVTNSTDWGTKNTDANIVTSLNGSTNRKVRYFGNPRTYTSLTPSSATGVNTVSQPFVYIHFFASGSLTFNKVELSGPGFEFDNLAVSTSAQTIDTRLVQVSSPINLVSGLNIVEFNSNGAGAQGTMETQVGSSATALRTNSFTRTGYTFGGWATAANGSGTSYANSASFPFSASSTLYAQWNPISYTVSYDSQGGSNVSDGTYATGSSITLPTAPTRSGYTFAGWFAASTGGTALGNSYSPPGTGNITLYAQWTSGSSSNTSQSQPSSPASLSALATTGSSSQTSIIGFGLVAFLISLGAALIWARRRHSVKL
jgi:uncharacterized repeat protein (TIGR02543 family)/LPXTG-motif cell wall-anchored protein